MFTAVDAVGLIDILLIIKIIKLFLSLHVRLHVRTWTVITAIITTIVDFTCSPRYKLVPQFVSLLVTIGKYTLKPTLEVQPLKPTSSMKLSPDVPDKCRTSTFGPFVSCSPPLEVISSSDRMD